MLAVISPGQGAQQVGLLEPWLAAPAFAEIVASGSELTGIDLVAAGTTMSESDIADTRITQPLLVAAGLGSLALLPPLGDLAVAAGHSVGEFTALATTGALSPNDALRLVGVRGAAMARASGDVPGAMVAVLGGDSEEVEAAVATAGCTVANVNLVGQVVAAGAVEAIERLMSAPPARARLRRLPVSGAFHSPLMLPATADLATAAEQTAIGTPTLPWISNADGAIVTDPTEIRIRLVNQVSLPVRWDRCLDMLQRLGVTATLELAPGGTLTAMVRRALPGVEAVALRSPDDLPEAERLIDLHTTTGQDVAVPWHVVVAPARGQVRALDPSPNTRLEPGDVLTEIATRTETVTVRANWPGRLVEWLVQDGDPVTDGQPLARISDSRHPC